MESHTCACPPFVFATQIPFWEIERLGGLDHVWLVLKKKGPPADCGNIKLLPRIQNQAGFSSLVTAMMSRTRCHAEAFAVKMGEEVPTNHNPEHNLWTETGENDRRT